MSKAIISSWSTCDPGTVQVTPNRLHIRNPDKLACVQFSLGNGRLGSWGGIEGDGVGGGMVYCFFPWVLLADRDLYRRHHCLPTLVLLFKFLTSETKGSFITSTNALLVGTF